MSSTQSSGMPWRSSSLAKSIWKSQRKLIPKSIKNRSWERPGAPKIDSNSVPRLSRDAPGHPRASRRRLRSVAGVTPARSGSSRGVPKGALERQRGRPGAPGARRGDQNRHQVAPGSGKIKFLVCGWFAKRGRSDFSSIFADFRFFRQVCKPSKVSRLLAKTGVRPVAERVESLERHSLAKPRKSPPKSSQNRRKTVSGAIFSVPNAISVDFGVPERTENLWENEMRNMFQK